MAFSLIRELHVSVTIVVVFFLLVLGGSYGEEGDSEAGGGGGGAGFNGGGTGFGGGTGGGTGFNGGGTGIGGGGTGGGTGFNGAGTGGGTGFNGGGTGFGGGGLGGGGSGGSGGFGGGGSGGNGGFGGGGAGGLGGVGGGGLGRGGLGANNPPELVAKALECLNEKHIYRECEEAWRLTLNGELNIAVAEAEEFCEGPCFTETHLALNCIEEILHNFRFFNRATIYDIRETLKSGCSYGPERGDFNVLEHIEDEENRSVKIKTRFWRLLGIVLMFAIVLII